MAKGSALAILALIIGIGGIGVGGYALYTVLFAQPTGLPENMVHRTYYDERIDDYATPTANTWYNIPDINIWVQVDSGESVYFSFTCAAFIDPSSVVAQMSFRLKIDGFSIIDTWTIVGPSSTGINDIFLSVAFQWRNASLSVGVHTVVVETRRDCAATSYIENCVLFVQTYT